MLPSGRKRDALGTFRSGVGAAKVQSDPTGCEGAPMQVVPGAMVEALGDSHSNHLHKQSKGYSRSVCP